MIGDSSCVKNPDGRQRNYIGDVDRRNEVSD